MSSKEIEALMRMNIYRSREDVIADAIRVLL